MLIPPGNRSQNINYSKKPILFVHGTYGEYPYWGENILNTLNQNDFDCWQFYYPYDTYVYNCGRLLKNTVTEVLKAGGPWSNQPGQYNSLINIVAHSMGGLITRSYIQGNDYR